MGLTMTEYANNDTPKIIAICSAGIGEGYQDLFFKAFCAYADAYNFKLLFFHSFSDLYVQGRHEEGESRVFKLMNLSAIDGIVLLYESFKSTEVVEDVLQRALEQNIPVVSIDHYIEGCYNISFNYDKAMQDIIEHFVTHHKFTTFNFIAGIQGNDFSEHRLDIFRRVMEEHNLPVDERRIGYGGFWSEPTHAVMDDFLSGELPLPEAIICANDSMAITAYQRLTAAGYRVPEDVCISGFDGIEEAINHIPSFTTAQHNFDKTGQTAFDILTQHFSGDNPPSRVYVDSKVILGETCGCVHMPPGASSRLNRRLFHRIENYNSFLLRQIELLASLTDTVSFDELFSSLRETILNIASPRVWICIVNDFVSQSSELSDKNAEAASEHSPVYSRQMEVLLYKQDWDFIPIPNFNVSQMLPDFPEAFGDCNNVMFFPLHVHDQTIGYFAMVYVPEHTQLYEMYSLVMNIANALETTKTHIKQQHIIQNLEDKYIHDPMTTLYNRRGFYQLLNPLYDECVKNHRRIMVLSIDLNGLKPINDTYGHAEGDNAIITVARALMSISMKDEICARFGGDEYVVAGVVDQDDSYIQEYTEKFQSYLDYYNQHSNKEYTVSASLGMVVCVPTADLTLDECIKEADDKMYAVKAKHHLCRSR